MVFVVVAGCNVGMYCCGMIYVNISTSVVVAGYNIGLCIVMKWYMFCLDNTSVRNKHITSSNIHADAFLYFLCSVSFWHSFSLPWYMNRHLGMKPLLYSFVVLFCTSAFYLSCWGTVSLLFLSIIYLLFSSLDSLTLCLGISIH